MKRLVLVLVASMLLVLILASGASASPATNTSVADTWNIPVSANFTQLGCHQPGTYMMVRISIFNPYTVPPPPLPPPPPPATIYPQTNTPTDYFYTGWDTATPVAQTTVRLEPNARCQAFFNWQVTPTFAKWSQPALNSVLAEPGEPAFTPITFPANPNWSPVWIMVRVIETSSNIHAFQYGVPRNWDTPGALLYAVKNMEFPQTIYDSPPAIGVLPQVPNQQICTGSFGDRYEYNFTTVPATLVAVHTRACQTNTFAQWYANWNDLSAGYANEVEFYSGP